MSVQHIKDPEQNKKALLRLLDEMLLRTTALGPHGFFDELSAMSRQRNIKWDPKAVLEHWWWLARLGVIALPGQLADSNNTGIPHFLLTERGRKLLERGEVSPHDPQRYYDAIKRGWGTPDSVVMVYLDEAVGAWAAGVYRASAVMLGCAAERLIILLAETVSQANIPPWSDRLKKKLAQSEKSPTAISQLFEDVRAALLSLAGEQKLPGKHSDSIDRKLTPIFELARGLRNSAGHPTAVEVMQDEAEGSLLLFPSFCFLTNDLMKALIAQ